MANTTELMSKMTDTQFLDAMTLASRKTREVLFARFKVKSKLKSIKRHTSENKAERIKKLHNCLKDAKSKEIAELCSEIIRNWLFNKRPMLKSALDFLNVKNDNGLVEEEIDFFTKLTKHQVEELVKHLENTFKKEDILLYLAYVDVPHLNSFTN